MSVSHVNQIDRRRIEAEILAEAFAALRARLPRAEALDVIRETTAAAARRAGQAFARAAPQGPGLKHFATVVDVWRAGGALDIEGETLGADEFSLTVTRCGYADLYIEEMGLPRELAVALSCSRDAAFAEGYSPRLTMRRPETIAGGAKRCAFVFSWK